MSQLFRIITLAIACFIAITCTNASSRHNAGNQKRQADRGPASYGQRRDVKIDRQGLYISHRSLMNLSQADKVAYYNIFVNFVEMQRKFMNKKGKKYSFHQIMSDLLIPELDAINCMSSSWALNNDTKEDVVNPSCTQLSSVFRPEDSKEWKTFGITGISFSHCQRDDNKDGVLDKAIMVCPLLGLERFQGTVRVLCSDNRNPSGGKNRPHSDSCIEQFNATSTEKGIKLLVSTLDQCQTSSSGLVDGMNCASLQESAKRTVQMYEKNCTDSAVTSNIAIQNFMKDRCGQMTKAVDEVAKTINLNRNPTDRSPAPDHPSCKQAMNDIENNYKPTKGAVSSDAWNYILDFSVSVCGRSDVPDRRAMAAKFGDCARGLPWPLNKDMKDALVSGKTFNQADLLDSARFAQNFSNAFGFSPLAMKKIMCGTPDSPVNGAAALYVHLNKTLDETMAESRVAMANEAVLSWTDFQKGGNPLKLSQKQFNILQKFNAQNQRTLVDLANGRTRNIKDFETDIEADDTTMAKSLIDALQNKTDVDAAMAQLELAIKEKNWTKNKQGIMRSALRKEIVNRLQNPLQEGRMKETAKLLNACKNEATKLAKENPDRSRDKLQANSSNCYYKEMPTGVFDFFDQRVNEPNKEGAAPYYIERKDKGVCYHPINDKGLKPESVGQKRLITGLFSNPLASPGDPITEKEINITLDEASFSSKSDSDPNRQYVLKVYTCGPDEPTLDSDVKQAIEEPTAI